MKKVMLPCNMTFLYIVHTEDNITHVTCYNIIRHTGGYNMLHALLNKVFGRSKKEVMMLSCIVSDGVIIPLSIAIR